MSLLAWLDNLPKDWDRKRADALLAYDKKPARTAEFESIDVFHYSIPVVQETGDGAIEPGSEIDSDKVYLNGTELLVSKLNPHKGCVLLARPHPLPIVGSTEFVPLTPKPGFDRGFAYYVYSSEPVRELISAEVKSATRSHQRANPEDITKVWLPVPPLPRQRAIAHYLDRETARIDALIAAKERVLGLLAEKRRALITRAVTRGLDPHAPLRDSGIPWLGKIPANWGTWKLSHFAAVGNGSTPSRENPNYWTDGEIPWLTSAAVNRDTVMAAEEFVSIEALAECHLPLVRPGSVLVGIVGQGKTRGLASYLTFQASVSQNVAFVTPNGRVMDGTFLRWVFFAAYDFLRGISDERGGAQGALNCEQLAALRVPVPPASEQRVIVDYIAAAKLDAVSIAAEQTITLLKERRAALIAAAVTGQIDIASASGATARSRG